MSKSKDNGGGNALLWIAGIGIVGIGTFLLIRHFNKKNQSSSSYVDLPTETTTDTTTTQPTIKEREKELAKDATSNATSNLIDSLFNRMFG